VPFKVGPVPTEEDAREELVGRLRESVKLRLISEVPLGAFLSGGVDSSAVVAMMSGLSADPVVTCSISFGDPAYNESAYARTVAERYRTRHHVGQVDPEDFSLVDRLAALYDEPYADSSAIPTYRVCELARKTVTVALSGDGGDESFGGYRRYRWHLNEERVRSLLPLGIRRPAFGLLGWLYPKADWAPRVLRAKSTLEALARDSVEAYFHSVSLLHDGMRRKLFSARFRGELQGYAAVEVLKRHAARAPSDHPLSLVQYLDLKTYLVGDINTKVDRASMAHSLEVRVPLLDHEVMEFAASLPSSYKLHGSSQKYVLKKAVRKLVGDETLNRTKMGFSVPLARWFRGELRPLFEERMFAKDAFVGELFEVAPIRTWWDRHQSGVSDFAPELWALLVLETWGRRFLRG
jgi:asparagine synthase (glutamine-hydrolysing)